MYDSWWTKNFLMKGYVYILESIKNGSYYIGSTADLSKRFSEHNEGRVKSTRYKRPYKLVFSYQFTGIRLAKKVETKLKSWKRKDFIEKVIRDQKLNFLDA